MKDFMKLVDECLVELKAINVPYSDKLSFTINSRAKSRWGMCHKNPDGSYTIEISDRLLANTVPDKSTKSTIIHEILHTVPDGANHTRCWKVWANRMNAHYNYNIQRCTSSEEKGVEPVVKTIKAKYTITCSHCGYKWYRTRATHVTRNPSHYRCHCGGSLSVEAI